MTGAAQDINLAHYTTVLLASANWTFAWGKLKLGVGTEAMKGLFEATAERRVWPTTSRTFR